MEVSRCKKGAYFGGEYSYSKSHFKSMQWRVFDEYIVPGTFAIYFKLKLGS